MKKSLLFFSVLISWTLSFSQNPNQDYYDLEFNSNRLKIQSLHKTTTKSSALKHVGSDAKQEGYVIKTCKELNKSTDSMDYHNLWEQLANSKDNPVIKLPLGPLEKNIARTFIINLANISDAKLTPTNILTFEKDPAYKLAIPLQYLIKNPSKLSSPYQNNVLFLPVIEGSVKAKDGFTSLIKDRKWNPEGEIGISQVWLPVKTIWFRREKLMAYTDSLYSYYCNKAQPCKAEPCLIDLISKGKTKEIPGLDVTDLHHLYFMWFTGKAALSFSKYTLFTPDTTAAFEEGQFVEHQLTAGYLSGEWNSYYYHQSGFSFFAKASYRLNINQTNLGDLKAKTVQRSIEVFDSATNTRFTQKLDDLVGKEGAFKNGIGHEVNLRTVALFGSYQKKFYIGLGTFMSYTYFNKTNKLNAGLSLEAPIQNNKNNNIVNLSLRVGWNDITKSRNAEEKKNYAPVIGLDLGVPLPNLYMKKGGS